MSRNIKRIFKILKDKGYGKGHNAWYQHIGPAPEKCLPQGGWFLELSEEFEFEQYHLGYNIKDALKEVKNLPTISKSRQALTQLREYFEKVFMIYEEKKLLSSLVWHLWVLDGNKEEISLRSDKKTMIDYLLDPISNFVKEIEEELDEWELTPSEGEDHD